MKITAGVLLIGVRSADGQVALEFGMTGLVDEAGVHSYYIDPAGALGLAVALKQHAELAEEQRKTAAARTRDGADIHRESAR